MILSMTGYGDAREQQEDRLVTAEVRTVNNRYLKVNIRCPDIYSSIESQIEKLVRSSVARGTLSLSLRAETVGQAGRYRLDPVVVRAYWEQTTAITDDLHLSPLQDIAPLLSLPGAITEADYGDIDFDTEWPLVERVVSAAVAKLNEFRAREGESMRDELKHHCGLVHEHLGVVAARAPEVIVQYRDKLKERVSRLLKDSDVAVSDADLIREVSVFADRCDINEEISRLRSHLDQFEHCLDEKASTGRKLDFLCQEMFREVNTVGSKSNSIEIAHAVVEMKGTVEKLREIVQNVE